MNNACLIRSLLLIIVKDITSFVFNNIAILIAREISKNGFHECLMMHNLSGVELNCLGISIVEGANYAK